MSLSALSDRVPVYTVMLISSLGSALAIFLLWGLASTSTGLLIAFALSYGFFAGGFSAVFAGAAQEFRRVTPGGDTGRADVGSMMGLLGAGRGIGNVVCGPVSEALLQHSTGWRRCNGRLFRSLWASHRLCRDDSRVDNVKLGSQSAQYALSLGMPEHEMLTDNSAA